MTSTPRPEAIVITGPTGTGKSELAVLIAEQLNGEIISADSRQVYRYMEIGTAKPTVALRARVPHHALDLVDPDGQYSAGRFARDARRWLAEIQSRGHVTVVAGGTGFFIRALLEPLAPEPDVDSERRDRLRRYLSRCSVKRQKRWLNRLDPVRARQLRGEGGRQRLSRSLEVALLSGRPHSRWIEWPPQIPPLSALVFCLRLSTAQLYPRLDRRFEEMMESGLLDEVRGLLGRFRRDAPGFKTPGYAELIGHLRGERTLEQVVEEAKRNTRRFARRQLTWFRHQLPEDTIWLRADDQRDQLVNEIVRRWKERTGRATGCPPSSPIASGG